MVKNHKDIELYGEILYEMDIRFIHFKEGEKRKWCHAWIEDIGDNSITIKH